MNVYEKGEKTNLRRTTYQRHGSCPRRSDPSSITEKESPNEPPTTSPVFRSRISRYVSMSPNQNDKHHYKPINRSTNQSTESELNQSISQSINKIKTQSINQSFNRSAGKTLKKVSKIFLAVKPKLIRTIHTPKCSGIFSPPHTNSVRIVFSRSPWWECRPGAAWADNPDQHARKTRKIPLHTEYPSDRWSRLKKEEEKKGYLSPITRREEKNTTDFEGVAASASSWHTPWSFVMSSSWGWM